ncbi:MAG: PIN domain-containing protein [Candidatus Latescibacteria bacterium]|nr:PIN domain-containing protein [Candidatus Latescibacterota bacterium]
MKVMVDTGVWSLSLRRNVVSNHPVVEELAELVREVRVQLIGPVRQEILSGIRSQVQSDGLRSRLRAFPDLQLEAPDYECAAEFFDLSRSRGVQGSNTDFLICAVSHRYEMPVLTTNGDFLRFREYLPIELHVPRNKGGANGDADAG